MAQFSAALWCHSVSESYTLPPYRCTAMSQMVVTPPHAAARVPVSKVSEASVPPNGSSKWV